MSSKRKTHRRGRRRGRGIRDNIFCIMLELKIKGDTELLMQMAKEHPEVASELGLDIP